jgi:glyceraldehyde 3-phosphate dehydrogenase
MSTLNVAINGFGRIGRVTLRQLIGRPDIKIVAINDLTDNQTLAHLYKYDSVHGVWPGAVSSDESSITIDGKKIPAFAERDPSQLPWGELQVDVVLECTGFFRTREGAQKHIDAGAQRVVISAPASGENPPKTIVLGINDGTLEAEDVLLSNASCTTNCSAPMVKILDEAFGIEMGYLSTVHAYTGDQKIHDAPHRDLRRARAAAENIVPTSTGAATALTKIFPHLSGKLQGSALRVPVIDGSITELTLLLKQDVTADQVNARFRDAAENELKRILQYNIDPIVSRDILSNPHSCIFDALLTSAQGRMVKVAGWYDNEYGYSARLSDLVVKLSRYKLSVV